MRGFQGKIYLGTHHGLYVLEGACPPLLTSGRLDGRTQIISVDSVPDNILWIATDRHAVRYDGNEFYCYEYGDNLAY